MIKDEMYNFEGIVRNLISSSFRKIIRDGRIVWYLPYDYPNEGIIKEEIEGESLSKVVDYFYKAVLQYGR